MLKYVLFTFLIPISISAQKSESFIYSYYFQLDSTDVNHSGEDVMLLEVKGEKSIFHSVYTLEANLFYFGNQEQIMVSGLDLINNPKPRLEYAIHANLKNDSLEIFQDYITYKFQYYEQNPEIVWKIENEQKPYMDYTVQKAATTFKGRKYIAWFTPEIPISSGPYKFKGLPGLIVEIYDPKKTHHFKLIEVGSKIKIPEDYFRNYSIITKKDFEDFLHRYRTDIYGGLPEGSVRFSEEDERRLKENMEERNRKRNNPIELED
ncbi:GLPGLI family protein [Moheibacter sp.]|uniref:GLPGLI family protein n=1 Tax=Moheibacter sp. TaxID=1965316 RepID=UPI003C749261